MRNNIIPAALIGLGLIVGGYFAGGRYTLVHTDSNAVARLDRLTGDVSMCIVGNGADSCGWTMRPRNASAANDLPPCKDGTSACEPWERAWPSARAAGTVVPGKAAN